MFIINNITLLPHLPFFLVHSAQNLVVKLLLIQICESLRMSVLLIKCAPCFARSSKMVFQTTNTLQTDNGYEMSAIFALLIVIENLLFSNIVDLDCVQRGCFVHTVFEALKQKHCEDDVLYTDCICI